MLHVTSVTCLLLQQLVPEKLRSTNSLESSLDLIRDISSCLNYLIDCCGLKLHQTTQNGFAAKMSKYPILEDQEHTNSRETITVPHAAESQQLNCHQKIRKYSLRSLITISIALNIFLVGTLASRELNSGGLVESNQIYC
jgi:hypothetical protein